MLLPPDLDRPKKRYPVVISYLNGVSKEMRRVMKGYRLKVYFKLTNMLREILVQPNGKVIKERVICMVYHISCYKCNDSYTGEKGRSLQARFMEHRRPSSVNSSFQTCKL